MLFTITVPLCLALTQLASAAHLCTVCRDEVFEKVADFSNKPHLYMRKHVYNASRNVKSCTYHDGHHTPVLCDYACMEVRIHGRFWDNVYRDCSEYIIAVLHGTDYSKFNDSAQFNVTDRRGRKLTISFCHERGEQCFGTLKIADANAYNSVSLTPKISLNFLLIVGIVSFSVIFLCIAIYIKCIYHGVQKQEMSEVLEMAHTTRRETMTASYTTEVLSNRRMEEPQEQNNPPGGFLLSPAPSIEPAN